MVKSVSKMGLSRKSLLLSVGLGGLWMFPKEMAARTWEVFVDGTGDAPTVQAGIDSATAGDTVLVRPGTYQETITFRGEDIIVRSTAGPEQTILDAVNLGARVVTFNGGESRAAILEGLSITHGQGGIFIHNSQPTIIGNIITANGPVQDGGGILCGASTFFPWYPMIRGNVITDNQANNLAGGLGTEQRMVPEILENYIAGNEARDGDGGGIYYRSFDNGAVIRGNIVLNNRAGDHGGGIYAALIGSPPPALEVEISWNLVAGNHAPGSAITGDSGGGITLIETNAWVHHNTIVGNEGGPSASPGGGIAVERVGSPIIEQNVIAFNVQGGGIFCLKGASPLLRNNLAWQNSGGDGMGSCATWWQSDGNVVDNPYFCDMAAGDFTVASNSGVMTHPAGPVGAFPTPGCGPVAVHLSTWGSLKARYQSSH